jgi:hypothetical protein
MQIVDELERHVILNSLTPLHSNSCINDVRNVRFAHRKLRDGAWPLFARVIGTSTFTLTPGHMTCLAMIAKQPQLRDRIKTLSFGTNYIDPSPNYTYSYYLKDRRTQREQQVRRHIRPIPKELKCGTIHGWRLDQNTLNRDLVVIEDAWNESRRAQDDFFVQPANACAQSLSKFFKALPRLINLRVLKGPCGPLESGCKSHERWFKIELGGVLSLEDHESIFRDYDMQGPYYFVPNEHFTFAVLDEIKTSDIKLEAILNDGQDTGIPHDDGSFPQHKSNDLMVSAIQSLQHAGSFTRLHTINLNSEVITSTWTENAGSSMQPSAAPLLNAPFTAAPLLKHLYLEGFRWRLDLEVANLSRVPSLELLAISRTNFIPSALTALITPSLTMLRLCELRPLDRDTQMASINEEDGDRSVDWAELLRQIIDRASLRVFELLDVTPMLRANAIALNQAIPSIVCRVPLVAQRNSFPYEEEDWWDEDPTWNSVYVNR